MKIVKRGKERVAIITAKEEGDFIDNWRKISKNKKSKESMEPFKPQDGDKLQTPRVLPVEDGGGAPSNTGRLDVTGYGANKRQRV